MLTLAGRTGYFIAALLLGLSIHMHFAIAFWGDQDWELLVARQWRDGGILYETQVPVTAPLLFYLYTLPVFLSQHFTGLLDYQWLVLLTLGLTALVIALCLRLMAFHPGFRENPRRWQFVLLLCFLLIFRIRPAFFGDREHLCIILTLPYLLRFLPGLKDAALPLRLRLLTGALAAPGFFIKPHCLLLWAAIQLVVMLRRPSLRLLVSPENCVMYGLGALYGYIVWYDTPSYLTFILPMAWLTYSAIQGSPGGFYAVLLSFLLTFAMLRPGIRSPFRGGIHYLSALLPFFYLYARLNNGWAYSYQPLMTVLLLLNGFVLWEFLYLKREGGLPSWKPMLGVGLCLLNFALETGYALDYFYDVHNHPCRGDAACSGYYEPFLKELEANHAPSFGTLGMDFTLWTRVARLSGARWDTRFAQFWMLPKIYVADDAFFRAHQDIFTYVGNALADDLNRNKPQLVFAEVSSALYAIRLRKPVDWPGDFSSVPAFKNAWSHYRLKDSIDNCTQLQPPEDAETKAGTWQREINCRYDVYERTP